MAEAALNAMAQQLVDLTLCKTRYDAWDLQWYTEGPFWRRTNMRYSREYKIIPDYEIGDMKHGKTLENILDESESLTKSLEQYKVNAGEKENAEGQLPSGSCAELKRPRPDAPGGKVFL